MNRGASVDYEAPTSNKRLAKKMWTSFVRGLRQVDGSPLYCDSCHQGNMKFLDHDHKKPEELSNWMEANFVAKLERSDGAKHGCETCHGDPFDGHFLSGWAK